MSFQRSRSTAASRGRSAFSAAISSRAASSWSVVRVVSQADQASVPASAAGRVSGARSVTPRNLPAPRRVVRCRVVAIGVCLRRLGVISSACLRRLGVIWAPLCAESALDGADRVRRRRPRRRRGRRRSRPRSGCGPGRGSAGRRRATSCPRRPAGRCRRRRAGPTPAGRRLRHAAPPRPRRRARTRRRRARRPPWPAGWLEYDGAARDVDAPRHQGVEVDLERRGAARQPEGLATRGCSSPAWPISWSPTTDPGAPARVPRACGSAAATSISTPSSAATARTTSSASDQSAARPRPTSRRRSRSPLRTAARNSGWAGARRRACPARPRVGRHSTPYTGAGPRSARERDGAGLEERDAGGAAPEVAGGGVEDAGQQRGRVERLLRATAGWTGVRRGAARRRRAARARRRSSSPTNGKLTTSTQPSAGQGAPDPAAQPLLAGEPATGRRRPGAPTAPGRSRRSGRPPRPGRRGRSGRAATAAGSP